jgi:hypothetical protein
MNMLVRNITTLLLVLSTLIDAYIHPNLRLQSNTNNELNMHKAHRKKETSRTNQMNQFMNASGLINDLLRDYDTRLRPDFGGKLA